jgi:hypothetical protein
VTSTREGAGADSRTPTVSFSDVNRTVTTTTPLDGTRNLTKTDTYDTRGRLVLSSVPSDGCGSATVDHRYQVPGSGSSYYGFSYEVVSNPYCSTSDLTIGWTRTKRDRNGRVVELAHYSDASPPAPFGSGTTSTGSITTAYYGDHKDRWTRRARSAGRCPDGLGRLASVVEDPDSSAYSTTYGYDLRDSLSDLPKLMSTRNVLLLAVRMDDELRTQASSSHCLRSSFRQRQRQAVQPRPCLQDRCGSLGHSNRP